MTGVTTHVNFDLPTHAQDVQRPVEKKFCRRFTTKPLITEILERCLSVAKKVPYNSQMTLHENYWPFMPQTDDLCFGPQMATYSNGHSLENGQRGIFSNVCWTESDRLGPSCKFLGQNSEYPVLQTLSNFLIRPKIWKSWHLMAYEMANWSRIQKCKPRCVEDPGVHLWTDAWWNWKKNDFLKGLYFGISTRTALESPKSDIFQIWPKRVLGHVISCLESKFEKRIPMGSVPNEQKEILMRDPIRWFKCKLKPPKNDFLKKPNFGKIFKLNCSNGKVDIFHKMS